MHLTRRQRMLERQARRRVQRTLATLYHPRPYEKPFTSIRPFSRTDKTEAENNNLLHVIGRPTTGKMLSSMAYYAVRENWRLVRKGW